MLFKTYEHIKNNLHTLELDLETGIVLNRKSNCVDSYGYKVLHLSGRQVKEHQLFAVALFDDNCVGMTVNHINEIKTDNSRINLELLTSIDNVKYTCSQPVKATHVLTGKEFIFESQIEASRQLNVLQTGVNNVITGRAKTHKGFKFERLVG